MPHARYCAPPPCVQDKIGKISYPDPWRDFRLAEHARGRREWSHEEVYALITQNGTACRPEDHQVGA